MFFFQDFDDFLVSGKWGGLGSSPSSSFFIVSLDFFDHGTKKSSDGYLDLSDRAEILRIDSSYEYYIF